MTSEQSHAEDHEARVLVRARPLGQTEELCRRLVEEVRLVEDTLVLAADAAWSEVINTVLVKKGVTVDYLRSAVSSPYVRRARRPLHHPLALGIAPTVLRWSAFSGMKYGETKTTKGRREQEGGRGDG